jgi:hypothetical protein
MKSSDSKESVSGWTSLEKAKLAVDIVQAIATIAVTVAIFIIGQRYTSSAANDKQKEEKFAQVTKQRVILWDTIGPKVNDIYCYYMYVGNWKELTPGSMIKHKRDLDKLIYSYRPFFSDEFFSRYQKFINAAYKTGTGWGKDALLRTRQIRPLDKELPDVTFTNEDNSREIYNAYVQLMKFSGQEMDVEIRDIQGKPPSPRGTVDLSNN